MRRWIVLRRPNNHYEPVAGPVIQIFEDEEAAVAEAKMLAAKHEGTIFTVFSEELELVKKPILFAKRPGDEEWDDDKSGTDAQAIG